MDFSKLTPTRVVLLGLLLVSAFVALFGPSQVAEWVEHFIHYFTPSENTP